jgi:hypothetical protein
MRFYMDEHVPQAITDGLRRRDVDVLTAVEDGYSGRLDPEALDRATELERVLYTQDTDFLDEGKRRQLAGIPFPGLIYCHQLKLPIGERVKQLELIAKCADPQEFANRVEYLPLRR